MQPGLSFCLHLFIKACNLLSYLGAGVHCSLIATGLLKNPTCIVKPVQKSYSPLRNIWYTRMVKRLVSGLVRSPLRRSTLGLVDFNIPLPADSGCIIVICHSPWRRLLVQWCIENKFALIVSGMIPTKSNKLIYRRAKGYKELRELVNHLRKHGRVIVSADVFNHLTNCPVQFLGKPANASLLPVRLAKLSGVPIITAIPQLQHGNINFIPGPAFDYPRLELNACNIIQQTLSFMENTIQKSPSVLESNIV